MQKGLFYVSLYMRLTSMKDIAQTRRFYVFYVYAGYLLETLCKQGVFTFSVYMLPTSIKDIAQTRRFYFFNVYAGYLFEIRTANTVLYDF